MRGYYVGQTIISDRGPSQDFTLGYMTFPEPSTFTSMTLNDTPMPMAIRKGSKRRDSRPQHRRKTLVAKLSATAVHHIRFVTSPGHKYDGVMSTWRTAIYSAGKAESIRFVDINALSTRRSLLVLGILALGAYDMSQWRGDCVLATVVLDASVKLQCTTLRHCTLWSDVLIISSNYGNVAR